MLWVWCPNAGGPTSVASVFPGASYVDIVGLDGYNWGSTRPSGWQTPAQIFASLLATVQSVAPATPVVINETGSVEAGGSKSSWISELFQYVRGSQMIGVVYSNFGSNWPLTSSSAALAAAAAALAAY